MKQIYYSLIYPYISYAILEWGSAYKTHIDKIQDKQNHSSRLIFFATTYGEHTERKLLVWKQILSQFSKTLNSGELARTS